MIPLNIDRPVIHPTSEHISRYPDEAVRSLVSGSSTKQFTTVARGNLKKSYTTTTRLDSSLGGKLSKEMIKTVTGKRRRREAKSDKHALNNELLLLVADRVNRPSRVREPRTRYSHVGESDRYRSK